MCRHLLKTTLRRSLTSQVSNLVPKSHFQVFVWAWDFLAAQKSEKITKTVVAMATVAMVTQKLIFPHILITFTPV